LALFRKQILKLIIKIKTTTKYIVLPITLNFPITINYHYTANNSNVQFGVSELKWATRNIV